MLLSIALTLGLVAGVWLIGAAATYVDTLMDRSNLGAISAKYESSGDPGLYTTTQGDPGGRSYGLYMFASKAGSVQLFFQWCQQSVKAVYREIGTILSDAYNYPSPGCGANFDAAWSYCSNTYGNTFADAQWEHVKERYYDELVRSVESAVPGFDMDNYSIALRNVFWSRAVQHGAGAYKGSVDASSGATRVILRAFDSLGGFANQPESQLIDAIYAECSKFEPTAGANYMSGVDSRKYGTEGKTLAYFYGASGDIQTGVYIRLAINEPAEAQVLLASATAKDSGAIISEGTYQLCSTGDTTRGVAATSSGLSLGPVSDVDEQRFKLNYYASGYYTLTNVANGKRLTDNSGSITLTSPSTSNAQMWQLTVTGNGYTLKNRATGKFLSLGEKNTLKMADNAALWQLPLSGDGWQLVGESYPSLISQLKEGNSSYTLRGTLQSSYNITKVTVSIQQYDTRKNVFNPVTATPNSKSFNLYSIDNAVTFSKLPAGHYVMVIEATNDHTGSDPFKVESEFYVSAGTAYTLTFDPNGGKLEGSSTKTATIGSVWGALPTASKSGAAFIGWFTRDGQQITENDLATCSLTLYAQYGETYTYTFLNADGSVYASGKAAPNQLIPAPEGTPVKAADSTSYYTFKGWSGGYIAGVTVMPSKDTSFTAEFTATNIPSGGVPTDPNTPSEPVGYVADNAPGTSVSALQKRLGNVTVYSGNTVVTSGNIATGMTVKLSNGTVSTLVVTGDANGDGKITITDVVKLQAHVVGKNTLTGAYSVAADINKDGKVTITDVVQAAQVTVGKRTIS